MQQLEMVEFGVAGLAEVRTLVNRWKKVLAGLAKEEAPSMVQLWRSEQSPSVRSLSHRRRCIPKFHHCQR